MTIIGVFVHSSAILVPRSFGRLSACSGYWRSRSARAVPQNSFTSTFDQETRLQQIRPFSAASDHDRMDVRGHTNSRRKSWVWEREVERSFKAHFFCLAHWSSLWRSAKGWRGCTQTLIPTKVGLPSEVRPIQHC